MTVPEYETPPAPAVVVDPRTQAAIWAAVNVALDDTTILNLVSPRGMIALKSGKLAAGISSPAKYMPKTIASMDARARTVRACAVYLLISVVMNKARGFVNQRCIERDLGRRMDDDLTAFHYPDVSP